MAVKKKEDKISSELEEQVLPDFYVNSVSVNSSFYEFEITHMLVSSDGQMKGGFHVRMSPQMMKETARLLSEEVSIWEKTHGKLQK